MKTTDINALSKLINQWTEQPGGLLPLLHAVQDAYGHVPADVVPTIAKSMNLSRAEVHGVISFYHDFRSTPVAGTTVQICRAEACQALGARALEEHAKASLELEYGESNEEAGVHLEPVYCLGNCSCGPSVRVKDRVYARVTPERFDELVSELAKETA